MRARSRLLSRPSASAPAQLPPGTTPLTGGGLLHVPDAAGAPPPLMVLLHGAGSSSASVAPILAGLAEEHGIVLLAPDSRGSTWDVIRGGFGPDVGCIDNALAHVFERLPVDPARVAIGGFSDGASYALSLGMANGDLFTHVIAFSPGFAAPDTRTGSPRVFITHGIDDRVLPIDRCSRRLVPLLEAGDYDVTYEEFDGGHTVPPELARRAVGWLGRPAPSDG